MHSRFNPVKRKPIGDNSSFAHASSLCFYLFFSLPLFYCETTTTTVTGVVIQSSSINYYYLLLYTYTHTHALSHSLTAYSLLSFLATLLYSHSSHCNSELQQPTNHHHQLCINPVTMSIPGIPSASTASNNTSTTTAGQQTSITPSPRSYQSPPPNTPTGPSSSSSTRNKLEQIIQVGACMHSAC